ncbi:Arc family DNA-binding protein, partial [Mesorhizobium sp.]
MPSKDRTIIHIRITPAFRQQLKLVAAQNGKSMNEEVLSRLER